MEVFVDPINPKRGFDTIQLVENKDKVTNLHINNLEKDWSFLNVYTSLKSINLRNCIIDSDDFFDQLENLETLIVDSNTYFRPATKKKIIKFKKLKKFIFNLPGDDDLNFDLEDEKKLRSNFINNYPNFPSAFDQLEEIELVNYDLFLKKNKTDYDYPINDNQIYYDVDFYNLSRLKKLENIKIINQDKEANEQIITDKIFNFPSHKKIKVNNILIKDIKNNFLKSKNLYLDYTYYHYDDNLFTNIEKHPSIKECLKVHWPSQKYNGYKDKFKELIKQEINHIIVGPTFDFMWETYIDFEGDSIDVLEKEYLKIKDLKKVTFEFPNNPTLIDDDKLIWKDKDEDGYIMDKFISHIHQIIKKDITVEIDFKDIKSSSDLNDPHDEYVQIFNLFINIQYNPKLKNKFRIKNLNAKECEDYFNQLVLNKFKSIVVIDDQSNSEVLKKFNNIELLHDWSIDMGLEFLGLNGGLTQFDINKLNSKKEESFKDFLWEDTSWFTQFAKKLHYKNPGKCKIFVKKSWLDNSSKLIFKNLETISFHYIGKKIFYSDESYFKDKIFLFPKSINYTNIKNLSIIASPCFSLQDLKIFTKLEDLTISNNLDENKPDLRTLPKFEKLINLNINMYFPIIKEEEKEILQNIESSLNLESIKISGLHTHNDETGRWSLIDLNLSNFHILKKLKILELTGVSLSDLKKIKSIKDLETFKLINPTVITEDMKSDEGTIDPPMTEENLNFLKDMNNLNELELYLPRFKLNDNNFNPEKLISLISPQVNKLKILCGFSKEKFLEAHKLYSKCLNYFREIKNLDIRIDCVDAPELKYNDKIDNAYTKAKLKLNREAKNPIIIDFSKIKNMKQLETFYLAIDPNFGIKTQNTINIADCKKITKIDLNIDWTDFKIDIKELNLIFNKIITERQKFLINANKEKKYKDKELIDSRYDLDEEDKEKYDLITDKNEKIIEINDEYLSTIIFNTYKKKVKK